MFINSLRHLDFAHYGFVPLQDKTSGSNYTPLGPKMETSMETTNAETDCVPQENGDSDECLAGDPETSGVEPRFPSEQVEENDDSL